MSDKNIEEISEELGVDQRNTGDIAIQIARLQLKINSLQLFHFSKHRKDNHSKVGLYKKIGSMRAREKYLKRENPVMYERLCAVLGRRIKKN